MFTQIFKEFINTETKKQQLHYHIPLIPFIKRFILYFLCSFVITGMLGLFVYGEIDFFMYILSISFTIAFYFSHDYYEHHFRKRNKIPFHLFNKSTYSTLKVIEFFVFYNLFLAMFIYTIIIPFHFYIITAFLMVTVFIIEVIIEIQSKHYGYTLIQFLNLKNTTITVSFYLIHLLLFLLIPTTKVFTTFFIIYFTTLLLYFYQGFFKSKRFKIHKILYSIIILGFFLLIPFMTIYEKEIPNPVYNAPSNITHQLTIDQIDEFYTSDHNIYIREENTLHVFSYTLYHLGDIELNDDMILKDTTNGIWVLEKSNVTDVTIYQVNPDNISLDELQILTLNETIISDLEQYSFYEVFELNNKNSSLYIINTTQLNTFYEVERNLDTNYYQTLIEYQNNEDKIVSSPYLNIESTNYGYTLKYYRPSFYTNVNQPYIYPYHNYSYFLTHIFHLQESPYIPLYTASAFDMIINQNNQQFDLNRTDRFEALYYYKIDEGPYPNNHFVSISKSYDNPNVFYLEVLNSDLTLQSEIYFKADSVHIDDNADIVYSLTKNENGYEIVRYSIFTSFYSDDSNNMYQKTYIGTSDDPMLLNSESKGLYIFAVALLIFLSLISPTKLLSEHENTKHTKRNLFLIFGNVMTLFTFIVIMLDMYQYILNIEIMLHFPMIFYFSLLALFFYILHLAHKNFPLLAKVLFIIGSISIIVITVILYKHEPVSSSYSVSNPNIHTTREGFMDYDTCFYNKQNTIFSKKIACVGDTDIENINITESQLIVEKNPFVSKIYELD